MILNFGKYKGQDVKDIASTARGASYLGWLVEQPIKDPKYAEANNSRNAEIRKIIGSQNDPVDIETPAPANSNALLQEMVDNTREIVRLLKTHIEPDALAKAYKKAQRDVPEEETPF